jgi:hypothetical protein
MVYQGESIMRNRMKRIAYQLALATVISGLVNWLPAPASNFSPAASARMTVGQSDAAPLQGEAAIRHLKQQELYDSLQQAVEATRYEARWEERPARGLRQSAYHAPNPAQQYDAYFTPDGLSLAPRKAAPNDASDVASDATAQAAELPEWQATMRLIGYGYGENLVAAGFPKLAVRGNRIEYRRDWSPITEWYVNKSAGLEQGFTLDTPPGARSEGARLRLALELTGDLSAELSEGGQAIALKLPNGEAALSYTDLHAYDAEGRELLSQMKVSEGQVILEVDDEQAVYPVTIDPTFTQEAQLIAIDGAADDLFGSSVAISWDYAVVGAPHDDILSKANRGSAYIFVRSGTNWSQQAKLLASDGEAGDFFGSSVAISGNTVVIGAHADDNSYANQGSAYVFVRSGTTWSEKQKLTAPGGFAGLNSWFGYSVAIDSDKIVIGAPGDDIGANTSQGEAHIFIISNGFWNWHQQLTASDGAAVDLFGHSVAIDGSTGRVLIGAPYDDIGANGNQGSAYIFGRQFATSPWTQQQKLMASDGAAGDLFGYSVAIHVSTLVVGAPQDDIGANTDRGSAYVFVRPTTTWSQQQKLTASDGASLDLFGYSVAISSDTSGLLVVVGALLDDIGTNQDQGSAYVFRRSFYNSTTWSQSQKLTALKGGAGDRFGKAVALPPSNAQHVVVGALNDTVGANISQGSAYVFRQ